MSRLNEILRELCALCAPSGREESVRKYIIEKIGGKADCMVDKLGNVIVTKKGKNPAAKKVLLDAHMDEVGIIATYITHDGFIKFGCVGGIDPAALFSKRVRFLNGIEGVIGCAPIHFSKGSDKEYPKTTEMFIDIGAATREDAEKMASLGESAVFVSDYVEFGNGKIKARALDDRIGCAIMLDMILDDLPYDLTFSFSVGEEVGLIGAKAVAFNVRPDISLAIEATTAADIADTSDDKKVCSLGEGPAVSFMDRHTVYNRELFDMAFDVAKQNDIKCQVKSAVAGGNNAGALHSTAEGCPTLAISVPCRYLHTGNCVISASDLDETAKLVRALAENCAK